MLFLIDEEFCRGKLPKILTKGKDYSTYTLVIKVIYEYNLYI